MLSYKHAFHAGNHADVIKHLTWLGVIAHLKKKQKPFTLFDTHSGAGCYPLTDENVQKNREYETGISPLVNTDGNTPFLQRYLQAVKPLWANQQYAGSPLLAVNALREQDSAHFMELHPTESETLSNVIRGLGKGNAHVHHRDGLEGLVAMTPPNPNRGAVLIDPPYERYDEYQEVENAVQQVLKRWQNAQLVIWYPLLSARAERKSGASEAMVSRLSSLGTTAFKAELIVADKSEDTGMYGSGVLLINPAWQLDEGIAASLAELTPLLGHHVHYHLNWLKTEDVR